MKQKKLLKKIGEKQFLFFENYFTTPDSFGAMTSTIDLYGLFNVELNNIGIIDFIEALKLYMNWKKMNFTFSPMRHFQKNGLPTVTVRGFTVNVDSK